MRVLGIDSGSVNLGYGLIKADGDLLSLIECGVLHAPAGHDKGERLAEIGGDLAKLLVDLRPDVAVLEAGFVSMQRGKLQQGVLVSAEARGVARFICARAKLPIFEYANNTAKKAATGNGKAKKGQVALLVRAALCMNKTPEPDAGDALALAIAHARALVAESRIRKAA
jgi:crossover junction endodeoxyribonuclease RuvC